MNALPYYASAATAHRTLRYWRVTLTSAVGKGSNMPPLRIRLRVYHKASVTEENAINWAFHRKGEALRAYFHGTVLVPMVRALHLDKNVAKAYNMELKAKYGDDWTYKSADAQQECASHFGLTLPSAVWNFMALSPNTRT